MSIYKDQEDHMSPSLPRIAAGLTGLQKRVFSDLRKILGGGKYKSPLFVALAAILATLFPFAGAQAQVNCVTGTPITGKVTTVVTGNPTTSSNTVIVNGGQECIIESTAEINPPTKEDTTRGVQLNGHNPRAIFRGRIHLENRRASNYSGAGSGHSFIAFFITGVGAKVTVDGGTITMSEISSNVFSLQNGANNPVIEFLSGSASLTNTGGRNIFLLGSADNTLTTLVFGGRATVVGHNPGDHRPALGPVRSVFFDDDTNADSKVILLPGALIYSGLDEFPLSGVYSRLGSNGYDPNNDKLYIGNFHAGIAPRTGWVHAGQWDFGHDATTSGPDELIVDTNPGVRFSVGNGANHHRHNDHELNAIYGVDNMRIRSGNVVLGGSVYMPNGKVYIHDAGRLTFEIGKRRHADGTDHPGPRLYPERIGEMIISRLVANQLIFTDEDPRVFIQFAHYLTASDIEKFRKQLVTSELEKLDPVNEARRTATKVRVSDGMVVSDAEGDGSPLSEILKLSNAIGVLYAGSSNLLTRSDWLIVSTDGPGGVQDVGRIWLKNGVGGLGDVKGRFRLLNNAAAGKIGQLRFPRVGTTGTGGGPGPGGPGPGTGGTGTGGGGGGGGGGILIVGLLAALMGGQDLDESESALGQYYSFDRKSAKNRRYGSSFFTGLFQSERGMWVRPAQSRFTSFGASYFGAVSHRMSWDLQQSGDYFLRANLTPATSVSPTGWHSSALGDTLSLTGGWQKEGRRLQFGITHGRYDANARMYDSATKGNLFGKSKFRHTSVHASAAQTLLDGPMKVSASASLMAGEVEQAAYDAENAVMRAKVPAYRQSYTGTRLGFSAKSRKWFALSDAVSVKPHLKVTSMRTRASVNDPVWLRQSDKVGVLTFESPTVLQGIPKSLNVVGIGTDVKPLDSRGVWRLGYAGMEVDGEYQHAAVAAYRMRF